MTDVLAADVKPICTGVTFNGWVIISYLSTTGTTWIRGTGVLSTSGDMDISRIHE
ncbi:hypothetical protein DPMN_015188 [Dreissena polymorpha]|uniref:Uncharacterized protein n=1 Tax=Dreissena polymorpha TaxID=45954 RepID=A0A9D4NC70_DREPO|nr:hypothetical protein DPMN_015188 [Dreissena polymorpha]